MDWFCMHCGQTCDIVTGCECTNKEESADAVRTVLSFWYAADELMTTSNWGVIDLERSAFAMSFQTLHERAFRLNNP